MKFFLLTMVVILATGFARTAVAGSRGYTVVMVGIESQEFFDSDAYKMFRDDEPQQLPEASKCWNERATAGKGLDHTTRIKVPKGITEVLARQIWSGNTKAAIQAQGILKKQDAYSRPEGYDGMYVVHATGEEIAVMAIGARIKVGALNPSKKVSIRWNKMNASETAANFDYALCRVSKPFDYKFNP